MKTIGEDKQIKQDLQIQKKREKSENRADDAFQYWAEKTRKALSPLEDGSEMDFGHLCGLISDWGNKTEKTQKLKQRYNECKKADIPFAPLWWWKYNNE
ncbi:MAG: hypothetical protein ABEI13_01160 [Candidatus Paceibacteria bacterium]